MRPISELTPSDALAAAKLAGGFPADDAELEWKIQKITLRTYLVEATGPLLEYFGFQVRTDEFRIDMKQNGQPEWLSMTDLDTARDYLTEKGYDVW